MNYRRLSKILILGLIVILCILYCKTIDKTESQYIENRNVIDVKAVKSLQELGNKAVREYLPRLWYRRRGCTQILCPGSSNRNSR